MSMPPRPPAAIAAAYDALTAPGSCCAHAAAVHAPDGACRLARNTRCGCTGWRPLEPAPDGEVASSGDPLVDAVHDVLAQHWTDYAGGGFLACRDDLVTAMRRWAAGALRITPTEADPW